ncbi:hypothetical protein SOVF_143580 [Spinacia oleracea]|nr:hypothetical protein SOVF_143580 [Spinacia oleracea]
MVMETGWAGVETTFGETNVRDYVQKSKGVTTLKVSTRSEVEVKMDVKQEDMKLNLSINGDLKFFSGPFKTKRLPFIVSCNNISGVSVHAACGFKLFTNGKTPDGKPKAQTPSQTPEPRPIDGGPTADESPPSPPVESFPPVKLTIQDKFVIMDNGILQTTIAKPAGFVTGIKYNGIDNILDTLNPEDDRGFKYMAIADNRQREMPVPEDRIKSRVEELIYPEAVIMTNPIEPQFKGEVR